MPHRGAFGLILTLHVLGAVLVIGPLAIAALLTAPLVRAGRPMLPVLRVLRRFLPLAAVASLGVVLLGVVMVHQGPFGSVRRFGDAWIADSLVLWAVAAVTTITVLTGGVAGAVTDLDADADADARAEPAGRAAGDQVAPPPGGRTRRAAAARDRRRLVRLGAGGLVTAGCWVAIVALMVIKPGS
jgi:hypothetical protein